MPDMKGEAEILTSSAAGARRAFLNIQSYKRVKTGILAFLLRLNSTRILL